MTDQREVRLAEIADQVRHLTESPLYEYRTRHGYLPVIGEGDPQARIMFVGEAPGEQEAKKGRPFAGAAGKILNELLTSVGLSREAVYITNIVKDRPPENRDPRADEIALYAPFLRQQIEIIQPSVIATLGRFAMQFVLSEFDLPQQGQAIGELHGMTLPAGAPYGPVVIVPLYHPAAAFYNLALRDTLTQDFQALKAFV